MRTSRGVVGAAPKAAQIQRLREVCEWYFERIYGRIEGAGITPFYCDPERVGHFAVRPAALAVGEHSAVFRLLVGLSMYQARRDRLLMDQQSSMLAEAVRSMVSPAALRRTIAETHCLHLDAAADFERRCTVYKRDGVWTARRAPICHVREGGYDPSSPDGRHGKTPVSR
ncbi:MAG: hypothetical protein LC118_09480 [Dehalococcoidia bacterium]|nr:hypothetical protein [Dehalococcoidia bacterium]